MHTFKYPNLHEINVTDETVKKVPDTFSLSSGIREPTSLEYFYSLIELKHDNKNATIVDVGAQVGLFSLYAKYLPDCRFHAFEPFKETYSILLDNLSLNNITNVKTYNFALGSSTETKKLHVPPDHLGLNTFGNKPTRFSSWNDFEVKIYKMDDILLNNVNSIDYIKCDTEGWEPQVFKGGEECIRKWKPELFFEVNGENLQQCESRWDLLVDYVKSLGYRYVRTVDEENMHFTYDND